VQRENSSNDGIYSLSQNNYNNNVTIILSTRPCKLDGEANFTLLHRAVQHCHITTKDSVYAGFYVFGSNDLNTWQLLTGNDRKTGEVTDIFVTRTHGKVKYYVFLFAAEVKPWDSVNLKKIDNSVNMLDIQFYHKLINKIR
jgi:predicted nucleotide-binding protein (sugar kinase/HSP70/actin superfamily)